ncbi:hypothetical protein SDC9_74743 [bioreactor metagenome]|uniref:Uncharacterized protein n=1 Tax=bioreactor metagenome TaxID=1076179 RepID=A0A644YQ41_9ZZZZ
MSQRIGSGTFRIVCKVLANTRYVFVKSLVVEDLFGFDRRVYYHPPQEDKVILFGEFH